MMATFANGGSIYQPFLVAESRRFGEEAEHLGGPRMVAHLVLSDFSMNLVRRGVTEVVRSGTGVAAKLKDFDVAGKTGTAQVPKGKEHGWFIAYAPVENPRVACASGVEHGGHGGKAAALNWRMTFWRWPWDRQKRSSRRKKKWRGIESQR